jgi:hypothetical protein
LSIAGGVARCALRQSQSANVGDGSKRELPSSSLMSASAGCGRVALGYVREVPQPDIPRCPSFGEAKADPPHLARWWRPAISPMRGCRRLSVLQGSSVGSSTGLSPAAKRGWRESRVRGMWAEQHRFMTSSPPLVTMIATSRRTKFSANAGRLPACARATGF